MFEATQVLNITGGPYRHKHYRARATVVYQNKAPTSQYRAVGHPIGEAHTLQHRYPRGITDHVHLEIADGRGRKLDAQTLIVARNVDDRLAAD